MARRCSRAIRTARNLAFFTEYPEGLRITALSFAHKRAAASLQGELSYRPGSPFMLAPGDVLPPFMSAAIPSLLRARVDAVPCGGLFHGYDLYALWQAQFGARHEWMLAGLPLAAGAEVVGKHAQGLPDPAVMRYGRSDIFGVGAIQGRCTMTTADAARQQPARLRNAECLGLSAARRRAAAAAGAAAGGERQRGLRARRKGLVGRHAAGGGTPVAQPGAALRVPRASSGGAGLPAFLGGDYNVTADRDTATLAAGVKF